MNDCIKLYGLKEYELERTVVVETDLQYSHLQIIFKLGANSDPSGKNGICHLCEHILLEMIDKEIKRSTDIKLNYIGYVDYTYSVLHFIASCKDNDFLKFTRVVVHTLNNLVPSSELIDLVKRDVINECSDRMNDTTDSLQSNIFLTDNTINIVPIGKINDIRSIKSEDICKYINEFKKNAYFLFLSNVKELPEDIIKDIRYMVNNDEIFFKKVYGKKTDNFSININSEGKKKCLKLFVLNRYDLQNIQDEIVDKLIQTIFYNRIYNWFDKKIENEKMTLKTSKKQLSFAYTYTIFEINNIETTRYDTIENIIKDKFKEKITIKEYEENTENLIQILNNIQVMNESYILDNVIRKVVFNESFLITKEQCLNWKKRLKMLPIEDVNKIKDNSFYDIYKVIKYY